MCVFPISSANSQQIFIKLSFLESTWNCPGLDWKKSGKIQIPGKNRTPISKNGFFMLFCDNKVFLVFQNINFNNHCGPWKSAWDWLARTTQTDPWISKTDHERNAAACPRLYKKWLKNFEQNGTCDQKNVITQILQSLYVIFFRL